MKRKIELLAPGGDVDSIKAAIVAGADAVYCGLNKFNARNRATNISFENLQGIIRLAHKNSCKVYLTLNIIIVDSEIPTLINLLNRIVNSNIDGVIVQDFGLYYLLSNYFPRLKIHASTQLTTHNEGQIQFLSKLGATRINLSRELNIHEIKVLAATAYKNSIETEVFVHGSYCLSFSGICYMSSVHGGKSGNRGRCSQPCRDKYLTTAQEKDYPLNLKDNSAYFDLKKLHDAGVDSLKIEGRIKEFEYVYTVVDTWKKQIRSFYKHGKLINNNKELYKVFNRDFSNSFLTGDIHKNMFIDNPMSHSTNHLSIENGHSPDDMMTKRADELYKEKAKVRDQVKNEIEKLSIAQVPVTIKVSGECGRPLNVEIKTSENSFIVLSDVNLAGKGTEALSRKMIFKRLKAINDTEYFIEKFDLENLHPNVFLPFKELTSIKKRVLFKLNGSKDTIAPVHLPVIKNHNKQNIAPTLSVLISSEKDVHLCENTDATIYYQLPNSIKHFYTELIDLFAKYDKLIPWFPSVLIGEDYSAAVKFLLKIKPGEIVTNNSGIAYKAYEEQIPWIAGPFLNTTNSYVLKCLKEGFNCRGAFISNEISKVQLKGIKRPEDFNLYYSIYRPIVVMTSRQCLLHQVTGCEKSKIDDTCISHCAKSATITNMKKDTFFINKTKGNYHEIYNESNLLNTEIVSDFPNLFTGFMVDLRDIETNTELELDKPGIIKLFGNFLNGDIESSIKLKDIIQPTTNIQYQKGI